MSHSPYRGQVQPGEREPLGANWDGTGTRFALWAPRAARVELCLLGEQSGGGGGEQRADLAPLDGGVWSARLSGVGPGQRYGVRVTGPPGDEGRFDPAKLLTDPWAQALAGQLRLDPALTTPGADTARVVPHSVVVAQPAPMPDSRPRIPWADTVVYEAHVRGLTRCHPAVPAALRGTFAGLAHPAVLEHLCNLGVTAVELLPVHHHVPELHLLRRGLTDYWGYSTLGFLAPHAGYSSRGELGGQVDDLAAMVAALHAAGLEVLLDVVYNHTAEGGADGPTLCWRGYDDAAWYRHSAHGGYDDVTGCGNTLDLREPMALRLVLDSLRRFAALGVDGFRFDLAPALARGDAGFDRRAPLLGAIAADPVLRELKLVAEPWDLGPGGYQVGGFPAPWAEWNGGFRDDVRDFWRGHADSAALARRLAGSREVYAPAARRPVASVSLVTSHDGFTLADLVAYERKHNEANGEGNRDGEDHSRSWNGGAEGPTDDPAVQAVRRRQARNLLATTLLSVGVPMLTAGDETGRTQLGNNNAYCQDSPVSWLDWDHGPQARALLAVARRLLALRRQQPQLRRTDWLTGAPIGDGGPDVTWLAADGSVLDGPGWAQARTTLQALFAADAGAPALLLVLHSGPDPVRVALPAADSSYRLLLDTGADDRGTRWVPRWPASSPLLVAGRSLLVMTGVGPATKPAGDDGVLSPTARPS